MNLLDKLDTQMYTHHMLSAILDLKRNCYFQILILLPEENVLKVMFLCHCKDITPTVKQSMAHGTSRTCVRP